MMNSLGTTPRTALLFTLLASAIGACGGHTEVGDALLGTGGATQDASVSLGGGSPGGASTGGAAGKETGGTGGWTSGGASGVAGGSGTGGATVDAAAPCKPGDTISCPCPGGVEGVEKCKSDGSGYGKCECPDASAGGGTGGAPMLCIPGKQEMCACPGGMQGVQVCLQDGSGFGPCNCGDGGAACVPGQQINCPCPGSVQGVQVCKPDGTGYLECQCSDAGAAGSGGSGCVLDCAGTQPAVMVWLPEGYGIDSTEVTRCQYKAWLDTHPSAAGQPSKCSWNTDFAPSEGCESNPIYWGPGCGNHPQVCVDWCDAYAYCKAVGKRLCGNVGGGPVAGKSQWNLACASGSLSYDYPYGDVYDQGQWCNGSSMHIQASVPVGSLPGCQSPIAGYAGVYDLSGNVREWVDQCNSNTPHPACAVRGGSFETVKDQLSCGYDLLWPSDTGNPDAGFRCCSDP